jgi:hypothetical protein
VPQVLLDPLRFWRGAPPPAPAAVVVVEGPDLAAVAAALDGATLDGVALDGATVGPAQRNGAALDEEAVDHLLPPPPPRPRRPAGGRRRPRPAARPRLLAAGAAAVVAVVALTLVVTLLVPHGSPPPAALPAAPGTGLTLTATDFTGDGLGAAAPDGSVYERVSGTVTAAVAARARPRLPEGTYRLDGRIRTAGGPFAYVQLLVDGQPVANGTVGKGWSEVGAVAHLRPGSRVGVLTAPLPDGTAPAQSVDLAQLRLVRVTDGFTTAGTRILDRAGQPVTFRGVNKNSLELTSTGYRMTDAEMQAIADYGATMVRLQLSEVFWLAGSCRYDEAYAGRVATAVRQLTGRGVAVLLDLHTNGGPASCVRGTPQQQNMADDGSVTFWKQVAERFQGNPLVAFDLYNEPRNIGGQVWRNGGDAGGWTAVGMQQLYDAVRSTGATNLVFVSGTGEAADLTVAGLGPVNGYGIVYAAHYYGGGDTCSAVTAPADLDQLWGAAARTAPVVITEFGSKCDSAAYMASVIAYAEAHHLGWLAFAWSADGPAAWSLLASWTTHYPSAAGLPVLQALWAARGWTTPGGRPDGAPTPAAPA